MEQAWRAYHRGEFSDLVAGLPVLLAAARAAAVELHGQQRRQAHAALSRAYQATAQAAGHLGQDDLARSAVERSMLAADVADDALLVAVGCNALSWVLLRQNESVPAGQVAMAAASGWTSWASRRRPASLPQAAKKILAAHTNDGGQCRARCGAWPCDMAISVATGGGPC